MIFGTSLGYQAEGFAAVREDPAAGARAKKLDETWLSPTRCGADSWPACAFLNGPFWALCLAPHQTKIDMQ